MEIKVGFNQATRLKTCSLPLFIDFCASFVLRTLHTFFTSGHILDVCRMLPFYISSLFYDVDATCMTPFSASLAWFCIIDVNAVNCSLLEVLGMGWSGVVLSAHANHSIEYCSHPAARDGQTAWKFPH